MASLRWKLWGSLILIAVILAGLMALVINWNTSREFSRYVEESSVRVNEFIENHLLDYYQENGSWDDLQDIISQSPYIGPLRVIVSDSSGMIVGDSLSRLQGIDISRTSLEDGNELVVDGNDIGDFFLMENTIQMGQGMAGMMRGGRFAEDNSLLSPAPEEQYISRSNTALWITGLITVAIAVIIGIVLTRQITKPVWALSRGARQIADGKLDYRVPVESRDELGKLAESFNDMAASLEASEESRRRFTADTAHELRTPLTIIEGTVNGILDGVFEPNQEHLNTVREQTEVLTELINDLRDISLVEAGRLHLELEATDIRPLLQRKAAQNEATTISKNISLELDLPEELPQVNIDSQRIEQVVNNLLSNALRYTPEGGRITITTTSLKDKVVIAVSDTGEGIRPEYLEHIFDRFYRADDARTRREGGTGLGLAIVQQIIQAHGGRVWAESKPGEGSTFFCELPAA